MKAGERVKASITRFLNKKLKLKVNETKSAVDKPMNRKFLGFTFGNVDSVVIQISSQSLERVKNKIRELTNPMRSVSMEERIKVINRYIIGWLGYYSLIEVPETIESIDGWLRRRMRSCQWQQWKKPKTRIRELIKLGLKESTARKMGYSRKGNWRCSRTPAMHKAMGIKHWKDRGLINLVARYEIYRESWRTAVYRTVCTVV